MTNPETSDSSRQPSIVVLDARLIGACGISWKPLRGIGNLTLYDDTLPEEVIGRTRDADCILTNRVRVTEEVIRSAPHLKMVGTFGTGLDHIDCGAAEARGVAVKNVPGYGRGAVAQMTIALLLEIARKVSFFDHYIKTSGWTNPADPVIADTRSMELTGKTMGIIGLGDIGYAVAEIAMAMGMNILAYRRHPKMEYASDRLRYASLREIYRESDVISLHCPLTEETRGLIDRRAVAEMKEGVILLNTSRGAVLDTDAVVEGLDSGKIYACGIDTFFPEPCGKGHPLACHPRCVATPHVAWSPFETRQHIVDLCAENLREVLSQNRRRGS